MPVSCPELTRIGKFVLTMSVLRPELTVAMDHF